MLISITNTSAVFLNIALIRCQIRNLKFDVAVRTLSINWSLSYIITNVSLIVKTSRSFRQLCKNPINSTDCLLEDFPVILGYLVSILTMAFIGLDRYMATCLYETYSACNPRIAVLVSVLTWGMATGIYFLNFAFSLPAYHLSICLTTLAGNKTFLTFVFSSLIALSWSIVFGYRYLVNRNQILLVESLDSQIYISLSGRLQLRRNIAATKALLPSVSLGASILFVAIIANLVSIYCLNENDNQFATWIAYSGEVLCAAQSLLHPIILFSRERGLRFAAYSDVKRLSAHLPLLKKPQT